MKRNVAAIVAIGVGFAGVASPPERRRGPRPRGIFPLRLAWQPILSAGLLGQPAGERARVFPRHIDHRLFAATPAMIVRPVLAVAVCDASVPLVKSDFALLDRKWPGDGDPMERPLVRGILPAHVEFARRYDDHLGAIRTIAKNLAGIR